MSTSPPGCTVPAVVALDAVEEVRRALCAEAAALQGGADCVLEFDGPAPGIAAIQLAAAARRSLRDKGCVVAWGPRAAEVFSGALDEGDAR